MREDLVVLEMSGGVGTITLNRPAVMNALDVPTVEALVESLRRCATDDAVSAIVLTGARKAFCAGGDMRAAARHIDEGGDPRVFFGSLTMQLHRAIADLRLIAKPVMAAVNGTAAGAGMSLAAACDLRFAAEGARFKQAYTSMGLVPDGGWTVFVPQLIGSARASDLLVRDPIVGSAEAARMGLVHEVVPDADLSARARAVADEFAASGSDAFGAAKALLNAWVFPSLETQLERERQGLLQRCVTPDFLKRLAAFTAKGKS